MIENVINIAATSLNVEPKEIKVIERLFGGKSHYTYLIEVLNQKYTIRIIGEGGNLFVDRKTEDKNIKIIDQLDLNNETVYFNVNTGVKIAKYLEGTVISNLDYKKHYEAIALAFKTLHNSGLKAVNNYDLLKRLSLYESYNQKQDSAYLELKTNWSTLYKKYYINRKQVFCHNDLQKNNMLIDHNNKVFLLDWEYAAMNDFYYDIASFGEGKMELLEVYLNRKPTEEEMRDVWFYKTFQNLQWYQVAKYKDSIDLSKKLKVDFKDLANYFISEATKHYVLIKDDY